MTFILKGDWPDAECMDCEKKGVAFRHWGPLAPAGVKVLNCGECWAKRQEYYTKHGAPKSLPVHEFFAVTVGPESCSLYRVADCQAAGRLVVEKIGLKGQGGAPVGAELKGGNLVGITRVGLQLYKEDGYPFMYQENGRPFSGETIRRQQAEELNVAHWGGGTSPIVALFASKGAAENCLQQENLRPCDERWHMETAVVLRAIGETHQTFIISTGKLRLPFEW